MQHRVSNYSPRRRQGSESNTDFRRAAPAACPLGISFASDNSADYIQEKTALD